MIVIVFGLPGSGKSYFASRLAQIIHAGYVNSDRVRTEIFEEGVYSEPEKKAVYGRMFDEMKEAVLQKKRLVLDATFHREDTRRMFVDEMSEKGGISFIEVQADESIVSERLKTKRPYSDADFEIYKLIRRQNEPLNDSHLVLKSTDNNIDEMLGKAVEYLKIKDDFGTNQ